MERVWLKQRRKEKNLSGIDVARLANIGVGTYYNYENGYRTPRKEHAIRIADILDFPVAYFFYDDVREARQREARKEVI
jgi:transcriptional regulator with XRE-family HTH domain